MNFFDFIAAVFGHRGHVPPMPVPRPVPPVVIPPIPPIIPPPPVPYPEDSPLAQSTAAALHRAINAARNANGLPPVALDPTISALSAAWAHRIARTNTLDHGDFVTRISTVAPGKFAGETIGEGFPTADAEVIGWLNSPGHRAILLGDYDAVGVGVGIATDGRLAYVADFVRNHP